MAKRRIGEFTPVGFVTGLVLCFIVFLCFYRKLPFGSSPPAPPPVENAVSSGELSRISQEIAEDRKQIESLSSRVKALETTIDQCRCKAPQNGK
jgi:hypothetical protein